MQNRNEINWYPISDLFLKENYVSVFKGIADEFSNGIPRFSLVELWNEKIELELETIKNKIEKSIDDGEANRNELLEKIYVGDKPTFKYRRILNKFRGNCGEIFAEAFFKAGYMAKYCIPSSYSPVDPSNERFIDASGLSPIDELPIGIQVKNYKENNLIAHEVFKKAAAEDDLWLRHDHKIPEDKIHLFLKSPHQFLFSFSYARDILRENYREVVVLIGPNEIDSVGLQGDKIKAIPGNSLFFQKIANEINLVS